MALVWARHSLPLQGEVQINPGKHRPQPATRSLALLLQGWEQASLPSSSLTFIPVSTSLLIPELCALGQGRRVGKAVGAGGRKPPHHLGVKTALGKKEKA